jgi:Protein of unknown function (DUF2934)
VSIYEESHHIAERAYLIWEEMGRPEGQALAHWLKAEAEMAANAATPASSAEPTLSVRRPRRKRT